MKSVPPMNRFLSHGHWSNEHNIWGWSTPINFQDQSLRTTASEGRLEVGLSFMKKRLCLHICIHIPCNTCMYVHIQSLCVYIYILYHIQIHLGGFVACLRNRISIFYHQQSTVHHLPISSSILPPTPHSSPRFHHRSIHDEAQELLLQGLLRRPLQIPIAGWQRHVAAPSTG